MVFGKLDFFLCKEKAFDALKNLYLLEIENLKTISKKDLSAIAIESIVYPLFGISIDGKVYQSSITQLDYFEQYYKNELNFLSQSLFLGKKIQYIVGKSNVPISISLVNEKLANELTQEQMASRKINIFSLDEVEKDEDNFQKKDKSLKILYFEANRIDYSFNKIKHYCGINPKFIQSNIIYVNYQKYLPYFFEYAKQGILNEEYEDLIGPFNISLKNNNMKFPKEWNDSIHLPQMPAYNLIKKNHEGITMINIGVGASNTKTITDHLAVLRPRFIMMLGHCAGMQSIQNIGDYLIGTDHIMLNFNNETYDFLSSSAAAEKCEGILLSNPVHKGAVVSVCDRNWEFNLNKTFAEVKNFNPFGVDMESAMMVKICNDYNIQSLSFLCISDRPLHKEIRLCKMAEQFYKERLKNHFYDAVKIIKNFYFEKQRLQDGSLKDGPLFR